MSSQICWFIKVQKKYLWLVVKFVDFESMTKDKLLDFNNNGKHKIPTNNICRYMWLENLSVFVNIPTGFIVVLAVFRSELSANGRAKWTNRCMIVFSCRMLTSPWFKTENFAGTDIIPRSLNATRNPKQQSEMHLSGDLWVSVMTPPHLSIKMFLLWIALVAWWFISQDLLSLCRIGNDIR